MKKYQVQYKELGRWLNYSNPCDTPEEAKTVKRWCERNHPTVRIVVI